MKILMLSCKKATELIEKKNVVNLSFGESIQLKMHKKMCKSCSNFEKQSSLIDNAFHKISSDEKYIVIHKNEELKVKIINKIKNQ